MFPGAPTNRREAIEVRLKWIEHRIDSLDAMTETEYALVARLAEGPPTPEKSRVARSAMSFLVTASTYRSLLELWRENLQSIVELEEESAQTAPPPSYWPHGIGDQ